MDSSAASIHVPVDPIEAVIQRVWRSWHNETCRRPSDEVTRIGGWIAGVSYDEWFALVDRLREAEANV